MAGGLFCLEAGIPVTREPIGPGAAEARQCGFMGADVVGVASVVGSGSVGVFGAMGVDQVAGRLS
jgi:hypothetical protein